MSLREYQRALVSEVHQLHQAGVRSVLLQSGTGSGKTHTAASIIQDWVAEGETVLFAAHLDTLIEDTHERLTRCGIEAGYIQAGRPSRPGARVQVCSLQTMHARGARPHCTRLVLDECHRAMGATVRSILGDYPRSLFLGLTATPQRGDGQPLGDVYERMVSGPTNKQLMAQGHLVPANVIAVPSHNENALAMDPADAWARWCRDRKTLVFAATKPHAHAVAARIQELGGRVGIILGDTGRAARRTVRAQLAAGELDVVVGVGVFLEGWDVPEVSAVILARAFGTMGAFLQAIGRGLRPAPGKADCIVVDLRSACMLHGLPDEDRKWSLDGTAVVRTEAMLALQHCKECLAIFRPAAVCPRCGAARETQERVVRVLNRAEKMERVSDLPQSERDKRYLGKLLWVAQNRIRLRGDAAKRWAVSQFVKKFQRQPEAA